MSGEKRVAASARGMPAPVGPFSPAVLGVPNLLLSGHVGQDPETGKLVPGGTGAQLERALNNVHALLREAGRDWGDVLKVNLYLVRLEDLEEVNAVYARIFAPPYPARTTVAVAALPLGARVEVELMAR